MDARTDDLRRAYDADASRRDAEEPDPWRLAVVDALAARVRESGLPGPVLEVGCGTGQLAHHLGASGIEVVAIDLSAGMAARATARGVRALVADVARLPFAAGAFAGALAFNSLLHTPQVRLPEILRELRRVLTPGAPITVVAWGGRTHEGPLDRDWLEPPRFYSTLSDADLLALETPGFDRLETRVLHEHARHGLHPQVLTLAASAPS